METPIKKILRITNEHADTYKGKEELRVKKAYRDIACAIEDFHLLKEEKTFTIEFAKKFNTHPAMIIGRLQHDNIIHYSIGRQFMEPIDLNPQPE